jgi:membrane protein
MPSSQAAPTDLRKDGWITVAKRTWAEGTEDHINLIAAGCAFYGLMAIFPGIVAVMAIAGFFIDPETIVDQADTLAGVMPQQAADIVIDQARSVADGDSSGLTVAAILGIVTAFYSATAGMRSLMEGLNVAFDITEPRGFFHGLAVRAVLTLGLIVGFLLIVGVLLILPLVLTFLLLGGASEVIMMWLRWPIVLIIVIGGLAILYQFGPNRDHRAWRWITPGAVVATLIWIAGSLAFAFYVSNFGSYNETFGALGGVIVLLLWLWLSAYIVLLGAELDSEMERVAKDMTPDPYPTKTKAPREDAFSSADGNG